MHHCQFCYLLTVLLTYLSEWPTEMDNKWGYDQVWRDLCDWYALRYTVERRWWTHCVVQERTDTWHGLSGVESSAHCINHDINQPRSRDSSTSSLSRNDAKENLPNARHLPATTDSTFAQADTVAASETLASRYWSFWFAIHVCDNRADTRFVDGPLTRQQWTFRNFIGR